MSIIETYPNMCNKCVHKDVIISDLKDEVVSLLTKLCEPWRCRSCNVPVWHAIIKGKAVYFNEDGSEHACPFVGIDKP